MNEDLRLALEYYALIRRGGMPYKQTVEAFKVLCAYPQWFTIHEPTPRGTDWVYSIDVHLPEIN